MNRQVTLIRDSFEIIKLTPQPIVMLFYGRLFDLDPSLRGLFKIDMKLQSKKLADTLAVVVENAERLDHLIPTLRQLGRLHATYGVLPEHYETVRIALLWALGQALQEDFDPETRVAWDAVLRYCNREMIAGTVD
jgi:hemoglobin-like flavoprotein